MPKSRTVAGEQETRSRSALQGRAGVTDYAQVIVATGVALAMCYFAKPVLVTVLVAVLIAFILEPLVSLFDRIHIPRWLGSLLAVMAALALCYGVLYYSYSRMSDFMRELPEYTNEIRDIALKYRQQTQQIQNTTDTILATGSQAGQPVTIVQQTSWTDLLTRSLAPAAELALMLSFIPFLAYFMLTTQDHVRTATVNLFAPENRSDVHATLGQIAQMIRRFIIGNLVIGLFIAVLSVAAFGAIGLPFFYVVGVISGVLSLLPYAGVLLAMVPPVVVSIGNASRTHLAVIAVTVLGAHLIAFNVLYPKFLGRRLELNALVVTLALLIWGFIWGAMGLILAVPMTGMMKIIFDHVDGLRPYGEWLGE